MCHSNRLTRAACWLADYSEWLQFCWDFVKSPRNDEIALQHFFLACSSGRIFFSFLCAACNFFLPTSACRKFFFKITHPPPPPQELNGRPLNVVVIDHIWNCQKMEYRYRKFLFSLHRRQIRRNESLILMRQLVSFKSKHSLDFPS